MHSPLFVAPQNSWTEANEQVAAIQLLASGLVPPWAALKMLTHSPRVRSGWSTPASSSSRQIAAGVDASNPAAASAPSAAGGAARASSATAATMRWGPMLANLPAHDRPALTGPRRVPPRVAAGGTPVILQTIQTPSPLA